MLTRVFMQGLDVTIPSLQISFPATGKTLTEGAASQHRQRNFPRDAYAPPLSDASRLDRTKDKEG